MQEHFQSEAHEEGLLMLRGLAIARTTPEALASFQTSPDSLISTFASHIVC